MPDLIGYPLNQSPFYRLSSKRKLADLLGFDVSDFSNLIDKSNFHEFKNKKGRLIQHPLKNGPLDSIHRDLAYSSDTHCQFLRSIIKARSMASVKLPHGSILLDELV